MRRYSTACHFFISILMMTILRPFDSWKKPVPAGLSVFRKWVGVAYRYRAYIGEYSPAGVCWLNREKESSHIRIFNICM